MKRHPFFGLIILLLLSACGSESSTEASAKEKQLEERIAELEAENKQLKEQTASQPVEETGSTSEEKEKDSFIEKNQQIEIPDTMEFTIDQVNFTRKIEPPTPGDFYSYYEVKEPGNIYLDTIISVKSLLTSAKSADSFFTVAVKYDGKYEYSTFSAIEEAGGSDFTYTNITNIEPLKTGRLHFIAELPEEAASDTKSVEVILSTSGETYTFKLR